MIISWIHRPSSCRRVSGAGTVVCWCMSDDEYCNEYSTHVFIYIEGSSDGRGTRRGVMYMTQHRLLVQVLG